ncbi:TetR/AcrR family transcriptional regulator [Leucothrix mucor]|uniref:TetR/AcrR family transcriptional regulator n=1 Tax=Leucothrix mucor TaxID=45248 RepID=UPI0003B3D19C|nr:TetR/AcrR family transcriptional regulator [Leucothrix mucor]
MPTMKKEKNSYHHGHLSESLLDAVDEMATKFGLEAISLRACAKLVGVSPSSAFRHYADKRALLTAFATRALHQLLESMASAKAHAEQNELDAFSEVSQAYIEFALTKPAFFRAMWREEIIYTSDEHYAAAVKLLSGYMQGGFVDTIHDKDPNSFSAQELLAWSSVHGLAHLFIEGPVGKGLDKSQKQQMAHGMIKSLAHSLRAAN